MQELLRIIKSSKQGKLAALFAVLAVFCLVSMIAGTVKIGPGIGSIVIFLAVAAIFIFVGKKNIDNPQKQSEARSLEKKRDEDFERGFKTTKNYKGYIQIDTQRKKWKAPKCKHGSTVYKYTDLLNFGLVEDGNTITKGGKGAALAGDVIFGAVGAVVGGITANRKTESTCSKMQIVLNVNSVKNPTLYITLLDEEVKKDSKEYQKAFQAAQTILGALEIISIG